MKTLLRGYFIEAQWLNAKYIPSVEEHLKLALVTCTYPTLITLSFVGMDETVTKETFEWMDKNPKKVKASSIISRFMDDIVGHKVSTRRRQFFILKFFSFSNKGNKHIQLAIYIIKLISFI